MVDSLWAWFVNAVARNLHTPQEGLFGWIIAKRLVVLNSFLEVNVVRLCDIRPDHSVLEIGHGPGIGLEEAYKQIKDGKGKVYGVDISPAMVEAASTKMQRAIEEKKVSLHLGSVSEIPLDENSIDRVFHCNTHMYWPDLDLAVKCIYRIMKPGGLMVTALRMDVLERAKGRGFMKYGPTDHNVYMECLKKNGFEDVRMLHFTDEESGCPYQAIFSRVAKKSVTPTTPSATPEGDNEIEGNNCESFSAASAKLK